MAYENALKVACTFCMQPAGENCTTSYGRVLDKPHTRRIEVARKQREADAERLAEANAVIQKIDPTQVGDPMDVPPGRDDDLAEAYRNGYNAGTIDARRNVLKVTMGMLGADGFLDVLSKHAIEDLFSE